MSKAKEGERVVGVAGFSFGDLIGGFFGAGAGGGGAKDTADPGYSWQLEAGLALVLKDMPADRKLALARRMQGIFRELETQAEAELAAATKGE